MPAVTVGVPVYRGQRFIEEALRSLQTQTHREIEVIVSLDGDDPASAQCCAPFLRDARFQLVVQPQRLGWVGNLNWLMEQVRTPYWCYHQQDDVLDPRYLETLVGVAEQTPEAAVVYCDIEAFGTLAATFVQSSVTGTPAARELALLNDHLPAVAFRGVTRVEALRLGGGIPPNEVDSFACDTAWMAAVARWGELRRVPQVLCRKRFHPENVHTKWAEWPPEKRTGAWIAHCAAMLEQAMLVEASTHERRMLWLAAAARLTSRISGYYVPLERLSPAERDALLDRFIERVRALETLDLPRLLESSWDVVLPLTRAFYAVSG